MQALSIPEPSITPRIMSADAAEAFSNERGKLAALLTPEQQSAARELAASLPDWTVPTGDLGEKFTKLSAVFQHRFGLPALHRINKFLVMDLALDLEKKPHIRNLPDQVLAMYPDAATRLLSWLRDSSDEEYHYPNDYFLKDVRFAGGMTVPCGAQVVDMRGAIGYRASARWLMRNRSWRYVKPTLRSGQVLPWFRIHTESRFLDDFNEPGWDACYMRIAALLRKHPEVLGMAGTSWFYDPQLDSVSPRLSYLRLRPLERGASVFPSGTSAFDIESATAKSASRRRLYEAGEYTPVSHTLLWPREKLLAWADGRPAR